MQTVPSFQTIEQNESFDIKHLPSIALVTSITWPSHFFKFNQRPDHDHNSVPCVQVIGYTLSLSSHTYIHPVTPAIFSSAYCYKKIMLSTGKKNNHDNHLNKLQ